MPPQSPTPKPDIVDTKGKSDIQYTDEELATIKELTSFFNKAPGQVNIPDSIPEDDLEQESDQDTPLEEQEESEEQPEIADSAESETQDITPESSLPETAEPVKIETPEEAPSVGLSDEQANMLLEADPPGDSNAEAPALDDSGLGDLGEAPALDDSGLGDLGEAPALDDSGLGDLGEAPALDDSGLGDLGEAPALDDSGLGDLGEAPALDDSGLGDLGEAPALDDSGLGDLGEAPALDDSGLGDLGEAPALDDAGLGDLGEAPALDDSGLGDVPDALPPLDETSLEDLGDLPQSDEEDSAVAPPSLEDLSPAVAFEDSPSSEEPRQEAFDSGFSDEARESRSDLSFDDDEVRTIREKLKAYPIQIRKLTINAIIEDKLSPDDTKNLTNLVKQEAPLNEVKQFLENKLGIELGDLTKKQGKPLIVVSRPGYTPEGVERAAQRAKFIKYGGAAALLAALIGFSGYYFAIKPWLYKNAISKGKDIILENAPLLPSVDSIERAEKNFKKARSYYPNKEDAYIQFAGAYQEIGLYDKTFEKLFGKVSLQQPVRLHGELISDSKKYWKKIKKVPTVNYAANPGKLNINNSLWSLQKKGAYLITHLDQKDANANVLLALGKFHSGHMQKFKNSPYKNNLLGIDYFKRILTFDITTPIFKKDEYIAKAMHGIGNVYHQQKDYYKSNEYFERIVTQQPDNILGHAGILRNLLKLYKKQKDPRIVVDYHNKLKYSLGIEEELPLYTLSNLAAFYIDLPEEDELRVHYNLSPKDSINAKALKERSLELLNILYRSEEKDDYGNIQEGNRFAEGYYQRGRYFQKIENQSRVAMEQFEYAYKYNPGHFLALNKRAEILINLNDYEGASDNLNLAIQQLSPENMALLGNKPEDDTLLEGNTGQIYFNMGKLIYLNAIEGMGDVGSWQRIKESEKFKSDLEFGLEALVRELDKAESYFQQAGSIGLELPERKTELNYFQGWSAYVKNNPTKALFYWDSIPPEWQLHNRNLELAKSNALYKLGINNSLQRKKHLKAALGYLMFLEGHYKTRSDNILKASDANKSHVKLFTRLSAIENNLGAIYELFGDEAKATEHYWKSINYSRRISRENEIARYNLKLSFRRKGLKAKESIPLIMDFVSPKLNETTEVSQN